MACAAFCARARSSADFVAGAALPQGQVIDRWIDRSNGKRERAREREREKDRDEGVNRVAGATLSQGQVQISWQAQRFRKVRRR